MKRPVLDESGELDREMGDGRFRDGGDAMFVASLSLSLVRNSIRG